MTNKLSHIEFTSVYRKIPNCPIERNSIILGTIWNLRVGQNHSLTQLAISKIVRLLYSCDTLFNCKSRWSVLDGMIPIGKRLSGIKMGFSKRQLIQSYARSVMSLWAARISLRKVNWIRGLLIHWGWIRIGNIIDYERERLLRIRENKKQLLGLVRSLMMLLKALILIRLGSCNQSVVWWNRREVHGTIICVNCRSNRSYP